MCGFTLAGIGEWGAGRFEGASAEAAPSSSHEGSRGAAVSPAVLPSVNNYLPASTPGFTFRRDVREVRLQFTVADEQGRLVQDLSPDDVRIFDDRAPVEHFSDFERAEDLPLQLGIAVDTSDSVKRVLPEEKAAAINFLGRILRPESDTAFVMGFGGDLKVWQNSTADRQRLSDAITQLKQPGWGTRLFDALYTACGDQFPASNAGGVTHRALIVLSDGDDTHSFRTLHDVIAIAQRGEVQIYGLSIRGKKAADRGDGILQRVADATGGRLYVAESSSDLDGAFAQIERDLRTQYYVSFPPQQAKPGYHALHIEVRPPQKLEVHARQGYYALAE
jgi:VWFA-related protein